MELKKIILIVYMAYLIILSLATYILYASDKSRAKRGVRRIPEKTLLLTSFLGGAFGGYSAMLTLRHKTKGEHRYFTFVNLLGIIVHTALVLLIIFVFKF